MTVEPDPRTAADDSEDATNTGQSAPAPAEGGDRTPPAHGGSPQSADADVVEGG